MPPAFDRVQIFLHDMGVNLGDLDVRMPHQLLHDPDIKTVFKQMSQHNDETCDR